MHLHVVGCIILHFSLFAPGTICTLHVLLNLVHFVLFALLVVSFASWLYISCPHALISALFALLVALFTLYFFAFFFHFAFRPRKIIFSFPISDRLCAKHSDSKVFFYVLTDDKYSILAV